MLRHIISSVLAAALWAGLLLQTPPAPPPDEPQEPAPPSEAAPQDPPPAPEAPQAPPEGEPPAAPGQSGVQSQSSDTGSVVRFFALGDGGTGGPDQHKVGRAIFDQCQRAGCDFGLLLGDNFYPNGVESTTDAQWQSKFEKPYADLLAAGIPFYAALGNHDYDDGKDWARGAHQVAYSQIQPLWRMPAPHYSFRRAEVTLVALDTQTIVANHQDADSVQSRAMAEAMGAGSRSWLIAFGHHPYISNGTNGNAPRPLARFVEEQLCGKVDVYLSGHDHSLQVLKSPRHCPTLFVVSGGGGYETYAVRGPNPDHFQTQTFGFVYVVAEPRKLSLELIDADGRSLYTHTLSR